jgi:hypothetical protein
MIITLILSLIFAFIPAPIYAQTPSPIMTITKTNPSIDEIQKIREAVQEKVKEKLNQIISPTSNKKGLIGTVIQIDGNQLVLDYKNTQSHLTVADDTVFIDAKRNKAKLDKLVVGQDILALGYQNDAGILETKRLIFIDLKTLESKQIVTVGKIVDISKTSPIFVLIPSANKNNQYQIKIDNNSKITTQDNIDIKSTDLKTGQKVVVLLTPDPKTAKTFLAQKIINMDYQPAVTPTLTPKPTKVVPTVKP